MQTNLTINVLEQLFRTIELLGVDGTINSLKEAQKDKHLTNDVDIEFVLTSVSDVTGVKKDRILFGTDRSDERKIAVCLSVYYIRNSFNYSFSEIKKIFKKDTSALSRYNSYVENLPKNPKTDFDKKIEEFSKQINYLINQRKLKK